MSLKHHYCQYLALKAHRYVALGAEIVNLIGLNLLNYSNEVCTVSKVAIVQDEARVLFMRVLIEMIDPAGVETASTTLDPMHPIALFK